MATHHPATQFDLRTVKTHIERWRNHVVRRMRAHDDRRPVWERALFLTEFWDDHPGDPRDAKLFEAP